ncbi:MAG: PorV/PorQ family protein [bacterium]|nr:PorV/PorQ family protein [bacterium]
MKLCFKLIIYMVILTLMLSTQLFAAGSNRAGTNAASELMIPVGARYIAMGGASAAGVSGLDAIYWNPAGLDRMPYIGAGLFSQMNYIADISVSYAAVGVKFGGIGSVGLSFKSLAIGDIAITTEDAPDGTGAIFSPQFMTIGLSYSRALTDRVAVGATAKIISETMDRVSATGFAFDIGVQYQNLGDIDGLNIGIVIKNLGPAMTYDGNGLLRKADPMDVNRPASFYRVVAGADELPSTMEIGLGYAINIGEVNKVTVESHFVNNNFDDDFGKLGLEYSFNDMLFLRGGYGLSVNNTQDITGENINIFGLALGVGFKYNFNGITIGIDYAYRAVNYFNTNNVFSVELAF